MKSVVSVIIPVFNAAEFIEKAVESALALEEVYEIILVEDNSTDNSLMICQSIASRHEKVSLFRHIGGVNRGEAASRNLGIKMAKCGLIAFLDADDWYYSYRFDKDLELFSKNLEIKICYSFSTINFSDGKSIPFGEKFDLNKKLGKNNSIDNFYQYAMSNDLVLGHVNANTLRREIFENGDFFDERLGMHTDTEFWWRLSRKYKFYGSELDKPVSAARRHDHNTIYKKSFKTKLILLLVWMDNINIKELKDFEKRVVIYQFARAISNPIKSPFLRKAILHCFQRISNSIRPLFIFLFYHWGMWKYNLYKN